MNAAAIGTSCPRSNVIVACGDGKRPVSAVFQKSPFGASVPSVRRSACSAPPARWADFPARRLAWSGLFVADVPQLLAKAAHSTTSAAQETFIQAPFTIDPFVESIWVLIPAA